MSTEALQLPFEQPRRDTQTGNILRHLQSGKSINPLESLRLYGCFRLGARCWDLREGKYDGVKYPITKEMIKVESGARVASYKLETA